MLRHRISLFSHQDEIDSLAHKIPLSMPQDLMKISTEFDQSHPWMPLGRFASAVATLYTSAATYHELSNVGNVASLKELAFLRTKLSGSCWNCKKERQRWIKWDPCQDMTRSKRTINTIATRIVNSNVISQTTPASHSKELPQDTVLWWFHMQTPLL